MSGGHNEEIDKRHIFMNDHYKLTSLLFKYENSFNFVNEKIKTICSMAKIENLFTTNSVDYNFQNFYDMKNVDQMITSLIIYTMECIDVLDNRLLVQEKQILNLQNIIYNNRYICEVITMRNVVFNYNDIGGNSIISGCNIQFFMNSILGRLNGFSDRYKIMFCNISKLEKRVRLNYRIK